jgi:hypothetical protein
VLAHFYGTDDVNFTATSDSLPGVVRSFRSLTACADEVGRSRIYGGIHFQFDNRAGKESGQRIADYVTANYLLPNDRLPQVRLEGFAHNRPQIRLHGHVGTTGVLEVSSDLTNWHAISTNLVVSGGTFFEDADGPSAAMRFYRIRER